MGAEVDFDELFRASDAALYEAKRSGRNRVARAPAEPPSCKHPRRCLAPCESASSSRRSSGASHGRSTSALARAAEAAGFDSLWIGDHLLYRGDGRPERGPMGRLGAPRRPWRPSPNGSPPRPAGRLHRLPSPRPSSRCMAATHRPAQRRALRRWGSDWGGTRRSSAPSGSPSIIASAGSRSPSRSSAGSWPASASPLAGPLPPASRTRSPPGARPPDPAHDRHRRPGSWSRPHPRDVWNTLVRLVREHAGGLRRDAMPRSTRAAQRAGRDARGDRPQRLRVRRARRRSPTPCRRVRRAREAGSASPQHCATSREAGADEAILVVHPIDERSIERLGGALALLGERA